MIFIKVLLSFLFHSTLGLDQNFLKCFQNVTTQLSNYFYPAIQKGNQYILKEKINQFSMIFMQDLKKYYQSDEPHYMFLSEAQLIFVDYDLKKQSFLFIINSIVFEIEDDILQTLEFIPQETLFLNLPQCQKIIQIFKVEYDWKIICQNQQFFNVYFCSNQVVQGLNVFETQSNQNITLQDNCILKILYFKNQNYLFFSELNCSNWKLYIINENYVQSVLEANQFDHQHLKNIIEVENIVYLIFSNQVLSLFLSSSIQSISKEIQLIFENDDPNYSIIDYQITLQFSKIIILQQKNSSSVYNNKIIRLDQKDYSTLVIMKDKPKKLISSNENLIFLMEPNKTEYTTENLNENIFFIEADSLDTWPKLNSFYFGLNKNYFLIYKLNYYSPIFNCNDYKNQSNILLKQKQLLFDTKVIDLQLHFFNNQSELSNLQLNQKLLVLNINDSNFSFILQTKEYFLDGTLPKLKFEVNDLISCQQKELQVVLHNKNVQQFTKLWTIVLLINNYLILVFQTVDLSVYLCELKSNKLIYVRKFELLSESNIYNFQQYLIIEHHNNQHLFILCLEKFPNINSYIFELPEQIVSIQFLNKAFIIIIQNCDQIKLNLFKQQNLSQNFIVNKVNNNFCQNNSQALDSIIFQFNKNKIMEIHEQFTISTNFEQGEIIKSFYIGTKNFIMLIKRFNQINFYKYYYFNLKFFQLFQLPLHNFEIVHPIQYKENGQYLILLASSNEKQNKYSLLIYALKKDFNEILYDIIEDIDNQFQLISDNVILYYRNNISYIYEIGLLQISCELKQIYFHKQQINLPVTLISNIYSEQTQNSTLNIVLQNEIKKLNLKDSNKLYLQNKITALNLDIRELVIGQVNSIKSNDFIIQLPIQKINNISQVLCPKFERNLCINYEKKYIITNLIEQTKINIPIMQGQQIFFEGQFIIVQDIIDSKIIIFWLNSSKLCEFKTNQIAQLQDLFIKKNLLFLIHLDFINIYDLQKIELQQTYKIYCEECKKVLVENNLELVLIFSKILKTRNIYIIQSNQENIVEIHELTIKNFPFHSYDFCRMDFLDIVELDTYLTSKVLIYSPIENIQILNARISKSFDEFYLTEYQMSLRLWQYNNFFNLHILTKDLLYTIDDNQPLRLYNVSEYHNYKFVDPIFQISFKDKKVEKINESHLIIISQMNEPHEIYQIQPYFLEFKNNQMMKNTFIIYNDVSEIEFEIFKHQEQNTKYFYYFVLLILIIYFIVFYILRRFRLIRKKNLQYQNTSF